MNGRTITLSAGLKRPLRLAFMLGALLVCGLGFGQGTENFENIPTGSSNSYQNRTWTGTDGVIWTAQGARTDQTINTKAICFGQNAHGTRNVISPVYAGGMGTLSFNYVRGFTGAGARTLQIFVNGTQYGSNINVSQVSDVVMLHTETINVGGSVQLEIRSITNGQVRVDDINWTPFTAGPTISHTAATDFASEAAGTVTVTLPISPAATGAGNVTISAVHGPGVTYGVPPADYETLPARIAGVITVPITVGATSVTFDIIINDDIVTEANENITFTITGTTGGTFVGTPTAQTFTILDDDVTPTVNFSTISISVMENIGAAQAFSLNINPPALVAGNITITITDGPGASCGGGNDYNIALPPFVPQPCGVFNIPFAAGATSATFNAYANNDVIVELTETVTFTVTGVPGGMAIGGSNSSTLTIGDNDSPPTVLAPGDLIIVGVNANDFACSGAPGYDLVSFFCFKPIVPGTQIIITDNGYERCNAGQWGNSEGTVRMTRTGIAIPAGQVITFRMENISGASNITSFAPDGAWTCTSLNNPVGIGFGTSVALNNGGDQLFFMQGGAWNSGTAPGTVPAHNATYSGTILYGFSSNPSPNWTAACTGSGSQLSNLPPGVECFSMAPTSASDFGKYDGLLTAASQRDWIIRVDDVANWTAYSTCGFYNSMGNSWVSAPILPIIVAPFVPGKWRGTTSTDWFDCKNWDDVQIPVATTDVTIDPAPGFSLRSCTVGLAGGLNPGGTGVCASVTMTSNTASTRILVVDVNSTLNIGGDLRQTTTAPSLLLNTLLNTNATLTATNLYLEGIGSTNNAGFLSTQPSALATFSGNVTIADGGWINLQSGAGGRMQVGGNWDNQRTEAWFAELNSTVEFIGTGAQSISIASGAEFFSNLIVNKPSGSLTLNSPVQVRTLLDLSNGLVNTSDPGGLLTLLNGSAWSNASDLSFVNGPMEKAGNTPFTFPVGKGSSLRPCGITGILGTTTNSFIAEYIPVTAYSWGIIMEPTLHHLSQCEHWLIDRRAGTPTATVQLTWDTPESCGVTDLPDLRVARWDIANSIWRDRGNGGAAGTLWTGTIPTAAVQTNADFNTLPGPLPITAWTLGSITDENPLPIELISFTAKVEEPWVRLDWTTASERNNDFFTVERSADGEHFMDIHEEMGAGNSQQVLNYLTFDREPLTGLSYYRLRQTDFDGTIELSSIVTVYRGIGTERPLVVFGDAAQLTALHGFPVGSNYELMDMTGRLIISGSVLQEDRLQLSASGLQRGAYLFRLSDGQRTESVRFVY
ncbi:MAG: T9SS type A sorting domain-containing protein [Flavobacteriales bacterium]|nr:T9SS type A sorting domain-containing protein [Flavobacteriales bacterium]